MFAHRCYLINYSTGFAQFLRYNCGSVCTIYLLLSDGNHTTVLTHRCRVTHTCISKVSHPLFRYFCRLFGAKPSSKRMLTYCQLDPQGLTSVKFQTKFKCFHSIRNVVCKNGAIMSRLQCVKARNRVEYFMRASLIHANNEKPLRYFCLCRFILFYNQSFLGNRI